MHFQVIYQNRERFFQESKAPREWVKKRKRKVKEKIKINRRSQLVLILLRHLKKKYSFEGLKLSSSTNEFKTICKLDLHVTRVMVAIFLTIFLMKSQDNECGLNAALLLASRRKL